MARFGWPQGRQGQAGRACRGRTDGCAARLAGETVSNTL
jgi:hypothetical protein